MSTTKLAATLIAVAAFTIAPAVATAAPKYTMFDATKNEVSIETIEFATGYWLPEVNDEVALVTSGDWRQSGP